uniref:hypothetical protein n=1 Tax=Nocardia abscessus TaxID=120957 RepID=UPI0024543335
MYRPSRCLVAVVLFCAAVGCGDTEPEPQPARGEIVSTTSLLNLPLEQTAALLAGGGIRTPVRNGVAPGTRGRPPRTPPGGAPPPRGGVVGGRPPRPPPPRRAGLGRLRGPGH